MKKPKDEKKHGCYFYLGFVPQPFCPIVLCPDRSTCALSQSVETDRPGRSVSTHSRLVLAYCKNEEQQARRIRQPSPHSATSLLGAPVTSDGVGLFSLLQKRGASTAPHQAAPHSATSLLGAPVTSDRAAPRSRCSLVSRQSDGSRHEASRQGLKGSQQYVLRAHSMMS